jgi:uncharacterized protein (DUF302 family)
MLRVSSEHHLEAIEEALRRAANRYGVSIMAVHPVGHLLRERAPEVSEDALSFTLCHHELYAALLAADIRMAAFLPCRVAAYAQAGRVTLESMAPVEFGRLLNRPDLVQLAGPLETVLCQIMQEAARPLAAAAHIPAAVHRGGLGATEEQVNLRASIPQRIDCRGTKVEDLGGTGEHDSQGG